MFAITIHNNLLKLVLPEQNLFREIPLDSLVINDGVIIDPKALSLKIREAVERPSITDREVVVGLNEERVYLKEVGVYGERSRTIPAAIVSKLSEVVPFGEEEIIYTYKLLGREEQVKERGSGGKEPRSDIFQVAAVDKKLLQSYIKTLALSGLDLIGLVPLSLSLAKFAPDADRPNLIICLEDSKLVYILVSIYGGVSFSSVHNLPRNLGESGTEFTQWTNEVLEFSGERVAGRDITKIFLCGQEQELMKGYLEEMGLVGESLPIVPDRNGASDAWVKAISLTNFESGDLDFLLPTQGGASKFGAVTSLIKRIARRA